MGNQPSDSECSVPAAVKDLVQRLLDEGTSPAGLSYVLAATAIDIGLQMAPRAESALAIVLGAIRDVASIHAEACEEVAEQEIDDIPELVTAANATIH